ncbi:hypothetical protein J5Y03_17435 [Bacillus sp. RG28]|uniref:Uncharacterized protein n=1 Tax=Gottfriedia endophytica TaxID=2820819 RepID=A0A940NRH3_9BACI|nr:hypothetical protein [Gottfriedia endophytica]MBP0726944.1 hypothetical protein [Gottfriedia endophytica]
MKFTLNFDLFPNLPAVLVSGITYIVIGILIYLIYKKQEEKPNKLKVLIVCWVGLFMFSINTSIYGTLIKIPILPLGVWILYWILRRNGNKERWIRYRAFAWFGFFVNFIFLLTSLLISPINELFYPSSSATSYISNVNHASILTTHPSAKPATLNKEKLHSQLSKMKEKPIYSDEWYNQTYENRDTNKSIERFPYILMDAIPKKGSGIKSIIYVERDGKGLLISIPSKQYYFRSKESFLDFEKGGTHDD